MARMVLDHKLTAHDPLALDDTGSELQAIGLLLGDKPATVAEVSALLV